MTFRERIADWISGGALRLAGECRARAENEEIQRAKELMKSEASLRRIEAAYIREREAAHEMMMCGNALSIAAQTTGGTAGPDQGLMDAIKAYAAALTAYRAAVEETAA